MVSRGLVGMAVFVVAFLLSQRLGKGVGSRECLL